MATRPPAASPDPAGNTPRPMSARWPRAETPGASREATFRPRHRPRRRMPVKTTPFLDARSPPGRTPPGAPAKSAQMSAPECTPTKMAALPGRPARMGEAGTPMQACRTRSPVSDTALKSRETPPDDGLRHRPKPHSQALSNRLAVAGAIPTQQSNQGGDHHGQRQPGNQRNGH